MNLWAIVPLPMTDADKTATAFAPLAGEAPLARVVRTALGGATSLACVVVATAAPLVDDVRKTLAAHELSVGVAGAAGAGTRADCMAAGLEYLQRQQVPAQHVLVYDVRRPLVSADLRDRVIAGLRRGREVVMPALPVTDSVKAVDARGSVTGTLDRSTLRAVQHPRGFAVDRLAALLTTRSSDEFDEFDDAVRAGVPVAVVEGDPDAFVADLPRDRQFLEAIIACR